MNRRLTLRPILYFVLALLSYPVMATHNRAGEITYKRIDPYTKVVGTKIVPVYTYSITLTKYTDDGPGIADRCVDTLYFGDGEHALSPRINGLTTGCSNCGYYGTTAIACGSLIVKETQPPYRVKVNIYTFIHTYPGPGSYLIRAYDPNRNGNVINIPNSINQPFYIESLLIIQSISGANTSPQFTYPPIDKACVGKCFQHNPGAYDPDFKDSLSYEITTSRGLDGFTVTGYSYPEADPPGTYSINPQTGLLSWCVPKQQGEYNLAFIVKEWRKNTSDDFELIGYVLRDMQVIVGTCPDNSPPSIVVPKDTCVEAKTLVQKTIIIRDPDDGNVVTVTGDGAPFHAVQPVATIVPNAGITYTASGSFFNANFQWQTTCDHIRHLPYQATFKAEDNGYPIKLTSFNSFNIRVVPPAVKNVTASPEGSAMRVSWNVSVCSTTVNPLLKFQVYRKTDCVTFVHSPCQTGVPASSGFQLIGETSASEFQFVDNNNGDGLVVGQNYSYIVVAVYKDGTTSMAGTQICSKLKRNVPVITNVDVATTSTSGQMQLKWVLPVANPDNFDTTVLRGPYSIVVKWMNGGTPKTLTTITSPYLLGLQQQFLHTNVNTVDSAQTYVLDFMSGTVTVGSSQKAASVFLIVTPSDRKMSLAWSAKTPWVNNSYTVFRKDPGATTFTSIATTTNVVYADVQHVVNRATYCYYVVSSGAYSDTTVVRPLFNRSEQACATAIDKTPPCAPSVSVNADCPNAKLEVVWSDVRKSCVDSGMVSDDVVRYDLYFKPTVNDQYTLIGSVPDRGPLSFVSDSREIISGCYAVMAIDSNNNMGPLSPDFCVETCPIFELPNIFTPNDDDVNDYFQAVRVRQIKTIDLSVLDRWGNLVYKTTDPYFKWDGISIATKLPVSDGTFFYVCQVYEPRLSGTVRRTLKGTVTVAR